MLVLAQLIVVVRDLDPVTGRKKIQVEDIVGAGLVIEAIEEGLAVAFVMEGSEFGCIEESAAACAVDGKEVSDLRIAITEPGRSPGRAEGAVAGIQVAE